MCNKLEHNFQVANKKALFYNMTDYYKGQGLKASQFLPQTFHVRYGLDDKVFQEFVKAFEEQDKLNIQEYQRTGEW